MSESFPDASVPPPAASSARAPALLIFVGAAIVVAIVSLVAGGVRWSGGAPSQTWAASTFNVVAGTARPDHERLIVSQTGANGSFIASLPTLALDADQYSGVEIRIRGLSAEQKVAVIWRQRFGSSQTHSFQTESAGDDGVRAVLKRDPSWSGAIVGLGFIMVGPMHTPIIIESVRAVSSSARAVAWETIRDWFSPSYWNGQSINVVFLGADFAPLSLPLFVFFATALALAAWFLYARRGPRPRLLSGLIVIALAGWIVLDLRWLVNLSEQVRQTAILFSGKTWEEKRLAAEDKQLFAFVEKAKEKIALQPGRIFFTSDFAYFRARAGYHFLPFNALSIVFHRNLYDPPTYRPGDYIAVFARSGIQYDPATGTLRWDGKAPVRADPVLADGFGALYRVSG